MAVQLFSHNEKAYKAAAAMLAGAGKAAIVHPTGTGKSYIAFKLIEDHPDRRFLWLSPSEYIFKTQCESIRRTAPDFRMDGVTFMTYARLMLQDGAAMLALQPDYIVLDEFHRSAAAQWSTGVTRLLEAFPNAKLLGLSATSIRYLDSNRDVGQELFGENQITMTLGEAIVRGILPAPTYVTTVFKYQQELEKYQRRIDSQRQGGLQDANQKYLDALRRALEQADGLDRIFARHMTVKNGKYIVFCSGYEHMQEMISNAHDWFAGVNPNMHLYKAYSDDPETSKAFANFKAEEGDALKLLYCIDMLNEGIHVSDISGVILFRPTISPIIYKQQIGRALTSGDSKTPLILDIVNNFDGLSSIAAIQEEMTLAVQRMAINGEKDQIVTDRFEVIEQVHDCRVLFERLQNSLSSTWEQNFAAASVYFAEYGDLRVPKKYVTPGGIALGQWILYMRMTRRGRTGGKLTPAQVERLDSIGMIWDNPREIVWERNFEAAQQYYGQYGNLMVPIHYVAEDGTKLGAWLSNMRTARQEGRTQALLTDERIKRLDRIGMVWDVTSEQWERNYAEAVHYYNAHDDLMVPAAYLTESGFALGKWMRNLQRARRKGLLTDGQISRLDALDMVWGNRNDLQWQHMYALAQRYYAKHGDLKVPLSYIAPGGEPLGRWVNRQRNARKNPGNENARLTPERIEKLNALAMDWRMEDAWEHRYELARQYKQQHGNAEIPAKYKTEDGIWLGTWLYRQRVLMNRGSLTPLQEQKLHALDKTVLQTHAEALWDRAYEAANAYYLAHGNIAVPKEFVSENGVRLNEWLSRQRRNRQEGKLSNEQISLLSKLGYRWDADDPWDANYKRARDYFAQHGNLQIPKKFDDGGEINLNLWLNRQRQKLEGRGNGAALTEAQRSKLLSLGVATASGGQGQGA